MGGRHLVGDQGLVGLGLTQVERLELGKRLQWADGLMEEQKGWDP